MSRLVTAGAESGPISGHTHSDQSDYSAGGFQIESGGDVPTDLCFGLYGYEAAQDGPQFFYGVRDEAYVRGYLYIPDATLGSAQVNIFGLTDGWNIERYHGGNENADLCLRLDTDGSLILCRESSAGTTPPRVVLATSAAGVITAQTRYRIEVYYLTHASAGQVIVRVEDAEVIDFTGDTLSTNNLTGGESIAVFLGAWLQGQPRIVWDSIAVNDTAGSVNNSWPGDSHVLGIVPDGMGTGTNNLSGTPEATNRYQNIDDIPPDDADYNSDSVSGQYDLYTLDTASTTFSSVNAVTVWVRSHYPATASTFKLVTKLDGVEYRSAALAPTQFVNNPPPEGIDGPWFRHIDFDKAPDGTDWTPAKLAALEVGFEVATSQEMRCTMLIVEVDGQATEPPCAPLTEVCNLRVIDHILFVDATYQDVTVTIFDGETFPAMDSPDSKMWHIKRIDDGSSGFTVTIDPSPGLIDLQATMTLDPMEAIQIVTDGFDFWIL